MLYVTGDVHANQCKWAEQIHPFLKPGDTLVVCGDFGVGFWRGPFWTEQNFYDYIAEQPYTVLFLDGNHENFDALNGYPVQTQYGGRVHVLRHNLIHLMRGEVYTIGGVTVFTFGGGYSLDKWFRTPGVSWWAQEMPSQEEYDNAEANLRRVNHKVDCILTHTAPSETVYYLSRRFAYRIKGDVPEERPLTFYLDTVRQSTEYKHWYFGHFHVDAELWRNQTALLSTIRVLNTGEIVKQWDSYEG